MAKEKKSAIEVQKEILSKIQETGGKVIIQIEQEVWNEGEKLSNPHQIKLPAKYISKEVLNLINLGYTVQFVSQEGIEPDKPTRIKKDTFVKENQTI